MLDRIKQLVEASGLSKTDLEEQTGISAYKWGNLFTGKQRVNEDHIQAIRKLWPQYTYWIVTGETLPESGQISPQIEESRKKLGTGG
ncbi:hypothetical protein MoryE10_33950 [Methylogaea oryzae]|uniref:HTH cro/C1-type domain-containing protein n=1 Tax=Methylogaea oryzae TaxID=1295382 RepID=A0A8D4VT36_9GAMM|nr:hypothetical protein MoryE10_33950 [Methylogaea oryzae]